MMRLGIYGGTFDPIHVGHLVLAEQCREQCHLDEVWFVPAAQPPHKLGATITDAKSRCEMVEFAIAGHAQFKLSRMEVDRPGPSFTVMTLEQLKTVDASRELFLLIGADSLYDLPTWKDPMRILELATVVAVNRGDRPLPNRTELARQFGEAGASRIQIIQMPGIDVSARDIRHRRHEGMSIRYLVPRAVEAYIAQNNLYI